MVSSSHAIFAFSPDTASLGGPRWASSLSRGSRAPGVPHGGARGPGPGPQAREAGVEEQAAKEVGAHLVSHHPPLPRAEPQASHAGLDLLDGDAHAPARIALAVRLR